MTAQLAELRPPALRRTVEDLLGDARARLRRLSPAAAHAAAAGGALLVDIRPAAQRREEGEIPGALVLERNVLEWRLDPAGAARIPEARYDVQVVVFCSEGYTSSLAAAALQDLGVRRATDLVGGFGAWSRAGLPVTPGGTPAGARSGALAPLLSVDDRRWEVRVDGRLVPLRLREFRLLQLLQSAAGAVVTRDVARRRLDLHDASGRALDVLVCRLRAALGPRAGGLVHTVRGAGYRLLEEAADRP
jgi:rhodanese-related sulfurtransferase